MLADVIKLTEKNSRPSGNGVTLNSNEAAKVPQQTKNSKPHDEKKHPK